MAASKPPIVIGASSVLSGANAYAGKDWLDGLKLGINQINASGGVLGRKIKIVTADNACDPATAVTATKKLIDDNVSIILGSVCSGSTLAAMPLVKAAKIVQLTDDSSSPQITQEAGVGGNPWEFRINLDSSMEANALASYVNKEVKSVYFIAENDAFGRDGVSGYESTLKKSGAKIAGASYYTPGSGDFDPILSAVQASGAKGIVLVSEPNDAAGIIRQLRAQGMTQKLFDGGGAMSDEFFSALGTPSLANGMVGAFFWNAAEDQKFANAYKKAYGTAPAPDSVGPYYDAFVLKRALQIAGSSNPLAIRNALKKVNLKQAWGTIKFDSHDQAHPNVALQEASNGTIKLLKVVPSVGE
ncbi:MAG TPA: ABC transporter substrate-binding protein [Solirubrobacteraceae bacterium]|nr:ABC transporter substrate-binding protein [Solirubrobacteraceae bacterium]